MNFYYVLIWLLVAIYSITSFTLIQFEGVGENAVIFGTVSPFILVALTHWITGGKENESTKTL